MQSMTKVAKSPLVPLALVAASCLSWFALQGAGSSPSPVTRTTTGTFFVAPLEETTADTVPQWADQADVVVSAQVTGEEAIQPPDSETADQAGMDLIGRVISLKVSDVIWRSEQATHPNPSTFQMNAFGWMQPDDGPRREAGVEDTARLEPGHEYVIALRWREAECAPGDDPVPAHWSALSSGAAIPADEGTIGVGEFEGTEVDLDDATEEIEAPAETVLGDFTGEAPEDLEGALDKANPDDSSPIAPTAGTCG